MANWKIIAFALAIGCSGWLFASEDEGPGFLNIDEWCKDRSTPAVIKSLFYEGSKNLSHAANQEFVWDRSDKTEGIILSVERDTLTVTYGVNFSTTKETVKRRERIIASLKDIHTTIGQLKEPLRVRNMIERPTNYAYTSMIVYISPTTELITREQIADFLEQLVKIQAITKKSKDWFVDDFSLFAKKYAAAREQSEI